MINVNYLYFFLTLLAICALMFFLFNFKSNKTHLNNKLILKNLLESFDLDLPEELKSLDNPSTDTQKLS